MIPAREGSTRRWVAGLLATFLIVGLGGAGSAPMAASALIGGGCQSDQFQGCASNYGVLAEGKCASTGPHCSNCVIDLESFCAPWVSCEVDNCRLDDYRSVGGGGPGH